MRLFLVFAAALTMCLPGSLALAQDNSFLGTYERLKDKAKKLQNSDEEPSTEPQTTSTPTPKQLPNKMAPKPGQAPRSTARVTPQTEPAPKFKKGLLFDNWRLGPSVTVGFPHLKTYGLDVQYQNKSGVGFAYGSWGVGIEQFGLTIKNYEGRYRNHVWDGVFYWGVLGGLQKITFTVGKEIDLFVVKYAAPIFMQYEVNSFYATPHIGWQYVWDIGFFVGAELGWQVSYFWKDEYTLRVYADEAKIKLENDEEFKELQNDLRAAGKRAGGFSPPHITLLKIGWMF